MKITKISDDKLIHLANNPNNIVYKYNDVSTPLPHHKIMPLSEVKKTIDEIWNITKTLIENKSTRQDTNKIRKKLKKKWPDFYLSHPLIFDRIVDVNTTEKEIQGLYYMIFLKESENKGHIADGAQKLQSFIMDKFGMTEDQYRKKYPKKKIEKFK